MSLTDNINLSHALTEIKQRLKDEQEHRIRARIQHFGAAINKYFTWPYTSFMNDSGYTTCIPTKYAKYFRITSRPFFVITSSFTSKAVNSINQHIETWAGFNVNNINHNKTTTDHYKKAWVWWCRNKQVHVATHLLYPLLKDTLKNYVIDVTNRCYIPQGKNDKEIALEVGIVVDMMYLGCLSKVMEQTVPFNNGQSFMSLIPPKAFIHANKLKQHFIDLGEEYDKKWDQQILQFGSGFIRHRSKVCCLIH